MSVSSTTAGEPSSRVLEYVLAGWERDKGEIREILPPAGDPEKQQLGSTADRATALAINERDRRNLVTLFKQAQSDTTHRSSVLPQDLGPRREQLAKLLQAQSTMDLGFRRERIQDFFHRVCEAGSDRYIEAADRQAPLMTKEEEAKLKAIYVELEKEDDDGGDEERGEEDRQGGDHVHV